MEEKNYDDGFGSSTPGSEIQGSIAKLPYIEKFADLLRIPKF